MPTDLDTAIELNIIDEMLDDLEILLATQRASDLRFTELYVETDSFDRAMTREMFTHQYNAI